MTALSQPREADQQDRHLLTALIGRIDRGICLFDADLKVVACNDAFLCLLGYPKELGVAGTTFARFVRHDSEHGSNDSLPGAAPAEGELEGPRPTPGTTKRSGRGGEPLELSTARLPDGGFLQVCVRAGPAEEDAGRLFAELQRFRGYAEASSDWFWETDAELRFTDLTARFDGTPGLNGIDVIGATLDGLVEQGRLASIDHDACQAAMRAREPFRDVCYAINGRPSEDKALVKLSGQPVIDIEGRFKGYRGSATDITVEHGAVQRADEIGRHLDAAIDAFSEGLALFDADDRLIFSNHRFRSFYRPIADQIVPGVSFQELILLKIEAGLFSDEGQSPDELRDQYLQLHQNPGQSLEVRLKDGRWLRVTDRRTADGGIVSVRSDITELKRRESSLTRLSNELRTQMMRFDTALNNMVQGLCMFDSQQRLIVCNERYLEMYGFSPDIVKPGITIQQIMEYSVALGNYNAEDAERAIAERPVHAARRDLATLLQRLRDGRIIAVMNRPMPAGGSLATYEDVTERIRAEEAMRAYAAKLEQSNRELQNFASVASHDLQEPLRKIEAFGTRLTTKCADQLDETGQMYIERMQSAAGRMRTLINDLLSYSRVTSKAAPFKPVDLKRIAEEVVSDLQITVERAEGRVEIGQLPEIDADPTQMRQLLQNLISNALKFKKSDVAPVVRIEGTIVRPPPPDLQFESGPSGQCQIRVADNGIGFEMKYGDRIFGIFQRLHGRNEYEGTGIGLATCRKIAERHQGSIRAESALGEGATFIIDLPVRQAATGE